MKSITRSCESKSKDTAHCVTIGKSGEILFCTGTLMRYDDMSGRWIDSNSKCDPPTQYYRGISSILMLIPFIDSINPTRAGLLSTYMQQAICTPGCTYDPKRTVVPLYNDQLIIRPRGDEFDDSDLTNVPGLNLFDVFCDMGYTYEDGIVLSVSAASRFRYLCRTTVLISMKSKNPKIGSYIQPYEYPWWQVAFEGK